MSRFTEQQLKAMGLEEYEPGKYRKKVLLPQDYVSLQNVHIKKPDGTVKPIVYDSPVDGVPIDEQEGYDALEEWMGMFPADDKAESKTPMLDQALERGKEDTTKLYDKIQFVDPKPLSFDGKAHKTYENDEFGQWDGLGKNAPPIKRADESDLDLYFESKRHEYEFDRVLDTFRSYLDSKKIQHSIDEFRKILQININNFSEHIVISNKTRIKPYIKGKKTPALPKKYMGPTYGWDEQDRLVDLATGDLVPSNPTKAGKPRLWRPNGQDIYSDYIQRDARNNYIKKLKEYLMPYFTERERIDDTKLRIELNFFIVENARYKLIDNDNRWIWEKAVGDVMKQTLIPDDNPRIVFSNLKNTYFVPREEDMKMEVIIWAKN